jgi:hypothetical protein
MDLNLNFKIILSLKFLLFFYLLLGNFVYAQDSVFKEFYQNNNQRELVIIKDLKLVKFLEGIIIEENECNKPNLVWHLQEKNKVYLLSLLINGTLSNESVKFITLINNNVVYLGKSSLDLKISKAKVKFEVNEDYIVFQDYSYWIFIKENNEYVLKKEIINCGN